LIDPAACSFGWWLVLICCERKVLWLVAGGWFVLREKYCWLVADKPNEQAAILSPFLEHDADGEPMQTVSESRSMTSRAPSRSHTHANAGHENGRCPGLIEWL
jgi:hypothetical protein